MGKFKAHQILFSHIYEEIKEKKKEAIMQSEPEARTSE
jgi:hypothetical protein